VLLCQPSDSSGSEYRRMLACIAFNARHTCTECMHLYYTRRCRALSLPDFNAVSSCTHVNESVNEY
jgi:hypothetical protein